MIDFKIKILLSILSAVVFSFIILLLAFALPLYKQTPKQIHPTMELKQVSQILKKRLG